MSHKAYFEKRENLKEKFNFAPEESLKNARLNFGKSLEIGAFNLTLERNGAFKKRDRKF